MNEFLGQFLVSLLQLDVAKRSISANAIDQIVELSAEQEAAVDRWVEDGPELERDGVVRWRCCDLQDRIGREFGIGLHERTVGKLLKLRFRRLSVRPHHPQSDPAAQAAFKGASLTW